MQNQKTDKKQKIFKDLSPEELILIQAYKGEGLTKYESYRKAYGAEGYSLPALKVQASRKFAEPHIRSVIEELTAEGLANLGLTIEDCVQDEIAFAQRAEDAGNFGAAGAARDRRNKLLGHYTERVEISTADPLASLREIEKFAPDIARQLAEASGIQWQSDDSPTTH